MGILRELEYIRTRFSKGQIEPELVGVLALVAIGAFALFMAPSLVKDIETLMRLSTSETVALDLGGLITISAAAPERISLSYSSLREDEIYNISISNERVVYVDSPIEGVQGTGKIGIALQPKAYDGVSSFTITKSRPDGENVYEFVAQ